MSYHGHTATRPRSVLVIVGGMMAWAGMAYGILIATPEYHRALTMNEEPVEMTWQELAEGGLTDNSHVRLVDVSLDHSEPMAAFEEMLGQWDPDAPIEDQAEAWELAAQDMNFGQVAQMVLEPIKVYPSDKDPTEVPARIVVPQNSWATEYAMAEIEASGTLTGRFTPRNGESFELQLTQALLAHADQAIAAGELDPNGEGDEKLPDPLADGPCWVFEPVYQVPNLADVQQKFWVCGLAVAVGLVICGAGGPSLACCIFFQGPSILSLLGYPMRYGRASRTTRIVYAVIGFGLMGYGYQKMFVEGQFGQIDGDIALAMLGFASGSIGAAALLGSMTSVVAEKLNVSLEPKTTKKVPERTMSFAEACSLTPPDAAETQRYIDPELVDRPDVETPESMTAIAESLLPLGFGDPQPAAWVEGESQRPVLIQLGCQEMVVAEMEQIGDQVRSRLISVLHDGIAIVTLSSNTPSHNAMRFGTSGLYTLSGSDDPAEMLSAHFEQTISMAEKRDTSVVAVESSEPHDVVLFARRVLAAVRAQYGEELIEVGDHRYGRFAFPVAPVPQLTAS